MCWKEMQEYRTLQQRSLQAMNIMNTLLSESILHMRSDTMITKLNIHKLFEIQKESQGGACTIH